jgi:tetratricopeptide (TPR) repeat protein
MSLLLLMLALAAQDSLQLGRQALAAGRLEEAETHLRAALSANAPRVFEVYYALGRLYLQKRDYAGARQAFEECLARAPRFAPALVGSARAALVLGDLEAGVAELKSAAGLPEAPPEAALLASDADLYSSRGAGASGEPVKDLSNAREYLRLGAFLLARDDKKAALRAFRVSSAIDDLNPIAYLFLKDLGEELPPPYPELPADFSRARERADAALASSILSRRSAFVPARLLLIDRHLGAKRPVEALVEYEKLIFELPPISGLYSLAARLAFSAEVYEVAECYASHALEHESGDTTLAFLLAEAQLAAGKAEKSIATCERTIASGGGTAPLYFTLGNALHGRMEIAASIAALRKAVELDPQAAENIASFALSSLTTEDYQNLRALLEAHVETHSDNVNTLYSLGVMSLREGDLERARGYLERVRELAPRNAQAYYNLALLYQRSGDDASAEEAMGRFREIKAGEEALWKEGHRRSNLRIRAEKAGLEERIEILTGLVKVPSQDAPGDFVLLGEALLSAGRLAEAREAFEKGRTQTARDAAALDGLGRVEAALGNQERARALSEASALLKRSCP